MSERQKCTSCGEFHEVEAWNRINVRENPELKSKVKDGSLFVWECPHCGKMNLLRTQTLFHDPDNHLMIWMLPSGVLSEAQEQALENQLASLSDSLEGYTLRRVDDIGSLIEKVNIFDAGLDDCTLEMCKYVTKMELNEKATDKELMDAPFKFYMVEGADNDLVLSYPLKGQMQGVKVGFNVYEDCAGIIRRNPSVKPGSGFARIDPDWVMKFFR